MWYYIFPRQTAEEIEHPLLISSLFYTMKGYQAGLFMGAGLGICAALARPIPGLTPQTLIQDTTRFMFGGSMAMAACGPGYALVRSAQYSWDRNREETFEIQRSIWHNRWDILTLAGALGGSFFLRKNIWMGIFGMSSKQVSSVPFLGGSVGAAAAAFLDLPFVILYPVYVSNAEEIDFIRRHLSFVPAEEEGEESEEAVDDILAKMRAENEEDAD